MRLTAHAYSTAYFPRSSRLSPSLSHAGKFEDFKVLGALLELDIGYCKKIDCKNALEVLPTMPWAAQIQTLGLSGTGAEGTMGTFFF